jgi:D-aspartate ligase
MTDLRPPAILLGGEHTAVPVARSLGRGGVAVHAIGKRGDPVRRSRHCQAFADLGEGEAMQQRWVDWLLSEAPRGVLLPCSDDGLEVVARNRAALVEHGHRPIEADDDLLLGMLDKERTHELAAAQGIPVPRTLTVRDESELATAAETIAYPAALKPVEAHKFRRHFPVKGFVCFERAELEDRFAAVRAAGVDVVLSEMVPGPDRYHSMYTYLDEHGNSLWEFTKQKLRQYPIRYGGGSYHIMDWDPEVAELGLRFCQSVGLRGFLNVEFKRDERDGELKLIECNHRFTESTALHLAAGLNVAVFTYLHLLGLPAPRLERSYKKGIALWYPLDDYRAFRDYQRNGEMSAWEWTRSLMRPQNFAMASVSDPGPMFASWQPRFRGAARRAKRLTGRRRELASQSS